jgi:hypothetical protein
MIIDRSHGGWLIGSAVLLALGGLLYVPYALLSVNGVSGGSVPGLVYAGIGSAMMVFAGLLGFRKRYRTWRMGRATSWMRGHLWLGFLSFPFILFHAGFQLGNGALTKLLMMLFLVVFVSGIAGAVLQHFMPKMMTERVPMETVFEQIDRVLGQLVDEAEHIVSEISGAVEREIEQAEKAEELLQESGKTRKSGLAAAPDERVSHKITMFFQSQVKPYLTSQRHSDQLLDDPVRRGAAIQQLKVLVPQALWPKLDDLESICEEKRELERQRRLHRILHGWLLFHIPASYALILLGAVHAFMALRY